MFVRSKMEIKFGRTVCSCYGWVALAEWGLRVRDISKAGIYTLQHECVQTPSFQQVSYLHVAKDDHSLCLPKKTLDGDLLSDISKAKWSIDCATIYLNDICTVVTIPVTVRVMAVHGGRSGLARSAIPVDT